MGITLPLGVATKFVVDTLLLSIRRYIRFDPVAWLGLHTSEVQQPRGCEYIRMGYGKL
jgi:hypothetical protein